jgi:hypothetical protein
LYSSQDRYVAKRPCDYNRLVLPGHPLDGTYLGHHEAWFPIIDRWLDYGDLPPPVV